MKKVERERRVTMVLFGASILSVLAVAYVLNMNESTTPTRSVGTFIAEPVKDITLSFTQQDAEALGLAVSRYETIVDSYLWRPVNTDVTLARGDDNVHVRQLARTLLLLGDLRVFPCPDENNDLASQVVSQPCYFDEQIEKGVKSIQRRHGLGVDGFVGSETLAVINRPPSETLKILEINLARFNQNPVTTKKTKSHLAKWTAWVDDKGDVNLRQVPDSAQTLVTLSKYHNSQLRRL